MTTKHTPVPKLVRYRYEDSSNIMTDRIRLMAVKDRDAAGAYARVSVHRDLSLIVSGGGPAMDRELIAANNEMCELANGVMRAVNAHDDLVAALEVIASEENAIRTTAFARQIASAALAKAKNAQETA